MDKELTMADKIQIVINTLKELDVKPTYENCNYMAGMYKLLIETRDEARRAEEDETDAGGAEAE